ncbi:MAG: hypothetical protein FJ399_04755 [Verrucomicrobia bacterium]|nr:hypothetical protein [Verrucomicrobiota bacterium]
MAFLHTNDAIALLLERLASLTLPSDESQANPAEKLFQRVGAFGANRLVSAMRAVFASEQRVCFIVPGGDTYSGARDALMLRSVRRTRLALLIADQAFDKDKTAALVGGPGNLGILAMKDRVIDDLVTAKFSREDFAIEPAEGEPLVIAEADQKSGNLGRECWLQWLACYAGESRCAIP